MPRRHPKPHASFQGGGAHRWGAALGHVCPSHYHAEEKHVVARGGLHTCPVATHPPGGSISYAMPARNHGPWRRSPRSPFRRTAVTRISCPHAQRTTCGRRKHTGRAHVLLPRSVLVPTIPRRPRPSLCPQPYRSASDCHRTRLEPAASKRPCRCAPEATRPKRGRLTPASSRSKAPPPSEGARTASIAGAEGGRRRRRVVARAHA